MSFFDVNNIFFTVFGYPMSYLEFVGTILNIAAVYLVAKEKVINWPVGILAVILYGVLFYQIQLYSDLVEQVYYFITGIYGWILWTKLRNGTAKNKYQVRHMSLRAKLYTALFIALGTVGLGYVIGNIHNWLPSLFPTAASYVYLDAGTTVAAFSAQMLMAWKYIENWYIWITIDVIAIWLYWVKNVKFVSLLFAIFLCICIRGVIHWKREYNSGLSDDEGELVRVIPQSES